METNELTPLHSTKFRAGDVYYVIGHIYEPKQSSMISTWVYEGLVEKECSSTSCDKPFHFHRFIEWNSWIDFKHNPHGTSNKVCTGVDVPSLHQAEQSYLTWEELLQKLKHYEVTFPTS